MYTGMYTLCLYTFELLHLSCVFLYQHLDNLVKRQLYVLSSHFLILGVGKEVWSKILPTHHLPSKHIHVLPYCDNDSDNDTYNCLIFCSIFFVFLKL